MPAGWRDVHKIQLKRRFVSRSTSGSLSRLDGPLGQEAAVTPALLYFPPVGGISPCASARACGIGVRDSFSSTFTPRATLNWWEGHVRGRVTGGRGGPV